MEFFNLIGGLALSLAVLLPALTTVYIARMYGRSGWRWLLIGILLPFISVFLIMALVSRESRRQEEEEEARRAAEKAAHTSASAPTTPASAPAPDATGRTSA